jgi:UPF0755 protein
MRLRILRKDAALRVPSIINFTIFSLSISGTIAAFVALMCLKPVSRDAKPRISAISIGMSSKAIAKQLARENLIRSSMMFQLMSRFSGVSRDLKAGTYQLSGSMTLMHIIDQLKAGRVETRRFVVPEGLTIAQIGQLWESEGFGTKEAFARSASAPQWRAKFRIEGETLEGYLFPNTYQLADGTPPHKHIEMMLNIFYRSWTPRLSEEAESLQLSTHEVVTLASIVEKEAKHAHERPLISAVYHNRLRRGWRLEADPTVLYALGNPKRRLTRVDLEVDSPYNTYLHKGLPPGPICNPGMDSIFAALRPISTSHLYFVAIDDGKHHFSTTFREHQKMIRQIKARGTN